MKKTKPRKYYCDIHAPDHCGFVTADAGELYRHYRKAGYLKTSTEDDFVRSWEELKKNKINEI